MLHGAIGLGSTYMRALDPWAERASAHLLRPARQRETPLGDVQRVSFAGGVEDLEGLRRGLGLGRIQLLGHSAGAYLAALYAAAHPETTAGVVLLNSGPPLTPELMERFGKSMSSRRTASRRCGTHARSRSPRSTGRGSRWPSNATSSTRSSRSSTTGRQVEQVSLGFTDITAANVQQAPQRMVGSLGELDPIHKFASIQAPTLVVHSELDPIPVEWSRLLAATIPSADFALIEGGSHFPMVENAEQLQTTVLPWLGKHA